MNRGRNSPRSSQEDDDSFWERFLSPLLKTEISEQYDPGFNKFRKPQLLELEEKPHNQNNCLSGIVLEKLREQSKTAEIVREKKVRKLKSELSRMVDVSQVDSGGTDRILQSQACGSSTTENASNSSLATSKEFALIAEEASRHMEAVKITDDEEEVKDNIDNTKQKNLEETEKEEEEVEQLSKEQEAKVEKVTGLARDLEKIKKEKSHQQLSASEWNLKNLKIYIKRDQVQLVETLVSRDAASGSEKLAIDRFSSLQNVLVMRSRQLLDDHQQFSSDKEKGLRLWSLQFTEPMLKEQVISFMVLEIIGTVCSLCDVQMKPEEILKKNEFSYSRVDFALVHKGAIFGIVEVKTPKTMIDKAVVQLVISLLKLQSLHYEERMQYLGILTDGFRFVLIRLHGDKFTFESTMNMDRPEINIHTAVSWDSLFKLCEYLHSVLGSVTANLLEIAKSI